MRLLNLELQLQSTYHRWSDENALFIVPVPTPIYFPLLCCEDIILYIALSFYPLVAWSYSSMRKHVLPLWRSTKLLYILARYMWLLKKTTFLLKITANEELWIFLAICDYCCNYYYHYLVVLLLLLLLLLLFLLFFDFLLLLPPFFFLQVNRIRELPQNSHIVATHTDSPDVSIYLNFVSLRSPLLSLSLFSLFIAGYHYLRF